LKEGFLYLISNDAFPGYVKVGITEDISSRLRTYQTSDPRRKYKVESYIFHPDVRAAEKQIKELMKPFAKRVRNEWYEIDLHMAVPRLQETLADREDIKIS
jgi:hypothetical protein